jgi:hypothetical protein
MGWMCFLPRKVHVCGFLLRDKNQHSYVATYAKEPHDIGGTSTFDNPQHLRMLQAARILPVQ